MGFYNFPHTRNYDSDLGFLIEKYKEISTENKNLSETVSELKNMVENYFSDLNVQTEINNKIDAMVRSGELAEILNVQLLENINERVDNLNNELDEVSNGLNTSNERITAITNNNKLYRNHFRFYVDGVNGSDDNDGLTRRTAYKSIEKVLDYLAESADTRCYIIAPGTYTISKVVLTSCVLHITAQVPNVEIQWTGKSPAVYNSHINISCEVSGDNSAEVVLTSLQEAPYFEGCTTTVTNVNFDFSNMIIYGGFFNSNGLTAKRLSFYYAVGRLTGYTNILNNDLENHAIIVDRGADLSLQDNFTVQPLGGDTARALIYCRRSNIRLLKAPTVQTNYRYGIVVNHGIGMIAANLVSAYRSNAREGNNLENASLLITTAGATI